MVRMATKIILLISIVLFEIGSANAQGSLLLIGGGNDRNRWADDPFRWFVQQADSGKIINIDVSSVATSYATTFKSWGADATSSSLQIPTKTVANDSATYYELISANGIFIEGGDQWPYVSNWKGTLVEDAIHEVFSKGGVIGGTSAGLAVLGEVVFDAKFGGAYPQDLAYNPYNNRIHFTDDFLTVLPGVLTDSHFHPRGRLGRLVPMLARQIQDSGRDSLIAIGVDDNTAFCLYPDRTGIVYGESTVSILYKMENSTIVCEPMKPLTFTNISYTQLNHGAVYDLNTRTLIETGLNLEPVTETLPEPAYQDVIMNGGDENTSQLGEIRIQNITSNELNAWRGNLRLAPGDSVVRQALIVPKVWNDSDFFENRIIGGMFGAAKYPGFYAIYLDDQSSVTIDEQGILTTTTLCYLFDTSTATHIGFNGSRSTNYPGVVNATLHWLGNGVTFDLKERYVEVDGEPFEPDSRYFNLLDNYPNPFNATTTIMYHNPKADRIRLDVFDINGRHVETLVDAIQSAGLHHIEWHAGGMASGLYLYRVASTRSQDVGKCLLLK